MLSFRLIKYSGASAKVGGGEEPGGPDCEGNPRFVFRFGSGGCGLSCGGTVRDLFEPSLYTRFTRKLHSQTATLSARIRGSSSKQHGGCRGFVAIGVPVKGRNHWLDVSGTR